MFSVLWEYSTISLFRRGFDQRISNLNESQQKKVYLLLTTLVSSPEVWEVSDVTDSNLCKILLFNCCTTIKKTIIISHYDNDLGPWIKSYYIAIDEIHLVELLSTRNWHRCRSSRSKTTNFSMWHMPLRWSTHMPNVRSLQWNTVTSETIMCNYFCDFVSFDINVICDVKTNSTIQVQYH